MMEMNGRRALVTGGAVGIGQAIAVALARAGADVVVSYNTHSPDETLEEIEKAGRRGRGLSADVTDSASVECLAKTAAEFLGGLDIVVANAGGLIARVDLAEMSDAHWQAVMDTNLSSAFYLVRAAVPRMRGPHGRIVLVSSLAASTGGSKGAAAYAAAKAGMLGLTRGLAKEVSALGITVNAIAPGLILETPFHETFTARDDQTRSIARIPVGRAGAPQDVAGAALYLSSDAAEFVTGTVLQVDGGQPLA